MLVRDAGRGNSPVRLPEGEYVFEQIDNPSGTDAPWLVLVGTLRGAAKPWWHEMERSGLAEIVEISCAV